MATKYQKLDDYEGFEINPKEETLRFACCDCGLVHDVGLSIFKGKVGMVFKRNKRSTAQLRRNNYGYLQQPVETDKYKMERIENE